MAEQPSAPGRAESAAEGPQRRRLPPDERRSAIFNAALKVFSDLGYDRATLNHVVERVGVSKGCLYHHFESKEQLLMELVREKVSTVQEEAEAVSAAPGSREEVLRSLVQSRPGEPLDAEKIGADLRRIYGRGDSRASIIGSWRSRGGAFC